MIHAFHALYKTADAANGPLEEAEFHTLLVESQMVNGTRVFLVREKHGWWNQEEHHAMHTFTTLSTEEGFSNYEEAAKLFDRQTQVRVDQGFIWAYAPDPYGEDPRGHLVTSLV